MHSKSNQPCRRARILSALKLSDKLNKNKDLGISSSNFKRAKAYEIAHPKPVVKPTLDQCDPLLIALARSINTSTSHRYASQRSTKVPVRVPAGFPVNHNFSQTVIYTFDGVNDETDLEESRADEDDSLDQCDPLLLALARSANTSTSRRYACQRSTKVPVRVPAGFPINRNFSQRVIETFENVKNETDIHGLSANEDVILVSGDETSKQEHGRSKGIDFSKLDMPEFPSPLLKNASDIVNWSPSTPVRAPMKNDHTPPSIVSSTLLTPGLTISSSSTTSSVVLNIDTSFKTPSSTSSSSSRRIKFSSGSSLTTPRWSNQKQKKPNNHLFTIHEMLLSPSGLPSPSPVMIQKGKSYAEVLAGLEFLNKFYGENSNEFNHNFI
ncbi:hypothetical protein DFH28DRAFT_1096382 [Melampsora americana]|nr:hypothetical protein DFH28DRAFT_1096382 [Melampsora americana]